MCRTWGGVWGRSSGEELGEEPEQANVSPTTVQLRDMQWPLDEEPNWSVCDGREANEGESFLHADLHKKKRAHYIRSINWCHLKAVI